MKVSELSRASGVPVATIKYYLREGLLPPGTKTGPNRASYDEGHLHRLALIRVLRDVGEVPVEKIRRITAALDRGHRTFDLTGEAMDALSSPGMSRQGQQPPTGYEEARQQVNRLIEGMGWNVRSDAPARQALVVALARIRSDFLPWMDAAALFPYAKAIDEIARMENSAVAGRFAESPERAIETAVLGTILVEPVLLCLRRLANEHQAAVRSTAEKPPA